jgi:hypothetical protein
MLKRHNNQSRAAKHTQPRQYSMYAFSLDRLHKDLACDLRKCKAEWQRSLIYQDFRVRVKALDLEDTTTPNNWLMGLAPEPQQVQVSTRVLFQGCQGTAFNNFLESLMAIGFDGTPDDLACPISTQGFKDPVINSSGHTYERKEYLAWMATETKKGLMHLDPLTGEVIQHPSFVASNLAIKTQTEQWWAVKEVKQIKTRRILSKTFARWMDAVGWI